MYFFQGVYLEDFLVSEEFWNRSRKLPFLTARGFKVGVLICFPVWSNLGLSSGPVSTHELWTVALCTLANLHTFLFLYLLQVEFSLIFILISRLLSL